MSNEQYVKLALVDDHTLFRKGLISLINMVDNHYQILFEADNGLDMQKKIDKKNLPDLILMDVNMPDMDGFASVAWINEHYPQINIMVLSMIEKEDSIIRMLKLGVKGYLSKDVEPKELGEALNAILKQGFYYTDFITGKLVHSLQNDDNKQLSEKFKQISERERDFLKYACTDMTYNEIASRMFLSPKTIDGYRDSLFHKLKVKNRVGLALFAVRNGIVEI
ncbi:MAG: response regulator transcription factor [Ginsengibacter sp.]